MMTRVGIISDTHGLFHPDLPEIFHHVDQIIHAGDIGGVRVLDALEQIAPVIAVRGNYDTEPELEGKLLPDPSGIEVAGLKTLLTHRMFTMGWNDIRHLVADNLNKGGDPPRLVIFGHAHFPVFEEISGIWFVNPGYAGPDPLEGPESVALIEIQGQAVEGEIIKL